MRETASCLRVSRLVVQVDDEHPGVWFGEQVATQMLVAPMEQPLQRGEVDHRLPVRPGVGDDACQFVTDVDHRYPPNSSVS